jgi:dTDP-glucose 4,6-dehydratase
MPRILVTGGAGFIGSYLCERFLEEGYEVICMDNLITGSADNIEHIKDSRFSFIHYDVTNYIYIQGKLDYILHFASPASPLDYLEYPIQTLKVGSLGTHKALGLAKEKGALIHPQDEDYWGNVNPVGPRGVYDEAKRFAEAITMAYQRYHKVDTRIVRIFNTYGPRMRIRDGRAIPNFIAQALKHEDVTVFGDGEQTRSFCYITDMVEGIYRLLMCDYNLPVNIGNPHEMTVIGLAKEIISLTSSKSKLVQMPLPEDDPKVRQPDITRARKTLGWEPQIGLNKGLKNTIEYFRKKMGIPE